MHSPFFTQVGQINALALLHTGGTNRRTLPSSPRWDKSMRSPFFTQVGQIIALTLLHTVFHTGWSNQCTYPITLGTGTCSTETYDCGNT